MLRLTKIIVVLTVLPVWSSGVAQTTPTDLSDGAVESVSDDTHSPTHSVPVQSGMALEDLSILLGRPADKVDTVGACGIMHTREWIKEGVRVITTGGRVTVVTQQAPTAN